MDWISSLKSGCSRIWPDFRHQIWPELELDLGENYCAYISCGNNFL